MREDLPTLDRPAIATWGQTSWAASSQRGALSRKRAWLGRFIRLPMKTPFGLGGSLRVGPRCRNFNFIIDSLRALPEQCPFPCRHQRYATDMSETSNKLEHLLSHWVEHNEAHLQNYRDWADRARVAGLNEVADALDRAVTTAADSGRALQAAGEALARTR